MPPGGWAKRKEAYIQAQSVGHEQHCLSSYRGVWERISFGQRLPAPRVLARHSLPVKENEGVFPSQVTDVLPKHGMTNFAL